MSDLHEPVNPAQLRRQLGLSQQAVAVRAGVSIGSVERFEGKFRDTTPIEHKILRALHDAERK